MGSRTSAAVLFATVMLSPTGPARAQEGACPADKTVHAQVVAIDMPMVFNRLGAQNVNWQMYALRHDLVTRGRERIEPLGDGDFDRAKATARAGRSVNVTLRPDLRPRPLVLRVAAGECLRVELTNLLGAVSNPFDADKDLLPPGHPMDQRSRAKVMDSDNQVASRRIGFHPTGLHLVGDIAADSSHVGANPSSLIGPGGSRTYTFFAPAEGSFLVTNAGAAFGGEGTAGTSGTGLFGAVAVQPVGARSFRGQVTEEELRLATRPLSAPGMSSPDIGPCAGDPTRACVAGGSRPGQPVIDYDATYPDTAPWVQEGKNGLPILAIEQRQADGVRRIVHSDLNAIIVGDEKDGSFPDKTYPLGNANPTLPNRLEAFREFVSIFHDENAAAQAFPGLFDDPVLSHTLHGVRDAFMINYGSAGVGAEVIANRLNVGPMHDCIDCAFEEFFLSSFTVGDPAMLVDLPANIGLEGLKPGRQRHSPSSIHNANQISVDRVGLNLHGHFADGVESQLQQLQTGLDGLASDPAQGDLTGLPGLNHGKIPLRGPKASESYYPHDPANVHHSYLGDFVKFRNLHTGKEQHIFHLHNHQWLFNPNDDNSNYIDAQAIGPGSGYTYEIAFGGSGNRNKSAGDAVFHCHYYPHFAQGMWYLWRIHDTFEAGSVLAASGGTADAPGIHATPYGLARGLPATGARALPDGELPQGSPIPAIVPLPGKALAPMPGRVEVVTNPAVSPQNGRPIGSLARVVEREFNPGFPFWIAGIEQTVGSRPPTPPLDMDPMVGGTDGGVPRHAVHGYSAGSVSEDSFTRLDASKKEKKAKPHYFPENGTDIEQVVMKFHERPWHDGLALWPNGTLVAQPFVTNGGGREAGAPFFDPCVDDRRRRLSDGVEGHYFSGNSALGLAGASPFNADNPRIYKGANIQLDVTINKLGDHYPQQRILALWEDVDATLATGFRTLGGAAGVVKPRPPEPLVLRMNTFDCARYLHTNLVPKEFEMDDYQVRTPTDVIGQHIHLPKWDLPSADGSANGWNYEDGTFSPGMVRSRIHAINEWNAAHAGSAVPNPYAAGQPAEDPTGAIQPTDALVPRPHYFFGRGGAFQLPAAECLALWATTPYDAFNNERNDRPGRPGQCDWLGARTTIQRWFSDPIINKEGVHRGLGITFTHDHLGPSTHQQVGLYATMLTEPPGSTWVHNETGELLYSRNEPGTECSQEFQPRPADPASDASAPNTDPGATNVGRCDGGPTSWQAVIRSGDEKQFETHREFFLQFGDFQHAYRLKEFRGVDAEGVLVAKDATGGDQSFRRAVTPSFRKPASPNFPDVVALPASCPGGKDQLEADEAGQALFDRIPRPCPEVISADDIGTMVVNYRQEPVAARVMTLDGGPGSPASTPATVHDPNGAKARQSIGPAGDLAYAFHSRTDRGLEALNDAVGLSGYEPLTHDVRPGDPFTPLLRAYSGDLVRIRIQAGSHEHEHTAAINGLKWLQAGSGFGQAPHSGWRGSQNIGLSEQFTLTARITDYAGNNHLHSTDRLLAIDSSQDGLWNGAWGLIRTLERRDPAKDVRPELRDDQDQLAILPKNPQPTLFFAGDPSLRPNDCPAKAPLRQYHLVATLANEVLAPTPTITLPGIGSIDPKGGTLVYNPRQTSISLQIFQETDDPATPGNEEGTLLKTEHFGVGPLHDPTAILIVHRSDIDPATGQLRPRAPVEPVVLRAAAGDCVQVVLENRLPIHPSHMPDLAGFTTLSLLMPQEVLGGDHDHTSFNNNRIRPSNRIGLHPQLLQYDVQYHDGSVAGFNRNSLVAPGLSKIYKWYAGELSFSIAASAPDPDRFCTVDARPESYEPFNLLRTAFVRSPDGRLRLSRPSNERFTLEVLNERVQRLLTDPWVEVAPEPAAIDSPPRERVLVPVPAIRAALPKVLRPLNPDEASLRQLRVQRPTLAARDLLIRTAPPSGVSDEAYRALIEQSLVAMVARPEIRACLDEPIAGVAQAEQLPPRLLDDVPAPLRRSLSQVADSALTYPPEVAFSSTESLLRQRRCAESVREPMAEALSRALTATALAERALAVSGQLADSIAYLVAGLDDDAVDGPFFAQKYALGREPTRLDRSTTRLLDSAGGPACVFSPIEFGGLNLTPPDRIKQGQKAAVGGLVVEPERSWWWERTEDLALDRQGSGPGASSPRETLATAHVFYPTRRDAQSPEQWHYFRDLVAIFQKGLNHRYGQPASGKSSAVGALAAEREDSWMSPSRIAPEDAHDAGQMAINYGSEPLWFRFGIDPSAPFGHGRSASSGIGALGEGFGGLSFAHEAFANSCCHGAAGDPVPAAGSPTPGPFTPIFSVLPHAETRLRVLLPTGVGRGTSQILHGHGWQRDPYLAEHTGSMLTLPYFAKPSTPLPARLHLAAGTPVDYGIASQCQGRNPLGMFVGAQDSITPTAHFDWLLESAGGAQGVPGDYLFRDIGGFGVTSGLWALMRVEGDALPEPLRHGLRLSCD